MDIYLKKEFLQFTGSFKERGARNALLHLTPEQKKAGVVSASLGRWYGIFFYEHILNMIAVKISFSFATIVYRLGCIGYLQFHIPQILQFIKGIIKY